METKVAIPYDRWKILVVDDEEDVHEVTQLACDGILFEDKPIQLLNAYRAEQARQMLKTHDDVALILMDVVMETDDAGLVLVRYIRQELGNLGVQIILRTGYPGKAPERQVVRDYGISDYWEKTDLTADKLHTLVISGLRAHQKYITLLAYLKQLKEEISRREKIEREKDRLIEELKEAAAKIKRLTGLLPVCSHCKKIRDNDGKWNQLESYIYKHTEADVSNSVCPECAKKYYPDYDIYEE
nr:response regulator [uncultured Desulfobacter sp.]